MVFTPCMQALSHLHWVGSALTPHLFFEGLAEHPNHLAIQRR